MSGLYIHIPFCKQACHYCDFHFSTNQNRMEDMIHAIAYEITLQKDYLEQKEISSIYFGGGTPSLLNRVHFELIFNRIREIFTVSSTPEITLEANPDDLAPTQLDILRKVGFNRLSIGIQSFDDAVLKFLNRAHDRKAAVAALQNSRKAGFENISIDLIYAIPGQRQEALLKNLELGMDFAPEHCSAYALTIEPRTVFGNWLDKNKMKPTSENENAEEFELLVSQLEKAGYEHYEISNFAKPGFQSFHNSNYWKDEPYLGIGPSAHSYNRTSRQFNVKNNATYIRSIMDGILPFEIEVLTREDKINEYIFTSLRTQWGCDLGKLILDHSFDLLERNESYINQLLSNKWAIIDHDFLKLTLKGKLLADKISMDLMV